MILDIMLAKGLEIEDRLRKKLMNNYTADVRPVLDLDKSVTVEFGLYLYQIMEMVSDNDTNN